MQYRSDIAGLRAIAVIPILLFHAGVSALPGGFVGVDVFFVISGFLITTIIVREMDEGHFSLIEFYRRRTARIVPALALVLVMTLTAGVFLLLPPELEDLGKSVSAASLFVSNFFFMHSTDYFAGAAESKSLLHTWSLAVEEQFYLIYPVGIVFIRRFFSMYLRKILIAGVFLSLVSAFILAKIKPDAAFYMIVPRAWELGLGGLVALGVFPKLKTGWLRNALTLAALAAIIGACLFITSERPFPAPWALVPVVSASVLIAYGKDTVCEALLSLPPMRFIGDLSYSIYLWHWPVITLYRLRTGFHLDIGETVGLVAASIILAWMTYLFIERPALRKLRSGKALPVVLCGFGLLVALAVVALLVSVNAERLGHNPAEVKRIANYLKYGKTSEHAYQYSGRNDCVLPNREEPGSLCMLRNHSKRNVLVFGDSHAAQYWRAFAEKYPEQNVMPAWHVGCRPTIASQGRPACVEMVHYVLNELKPGSEIDSVVVVARWRQGDIPQAVEMIRLLVRRGFSVMVIGPGVEYDGDYPLLLARARLQGREGPSDSLRLRKRRQMDLALRPMVEGAGARYVSAQEIECPLDRCVFVAPDGAPFHFDYGHLTLGAARYMVSRMPAP